MATVDPMVLAPGEPSVPYIPSDGSEHLEVIILDRWSVHDHGMMLSSDDEHLGHGQQLVVTSCTMCDGRYK